MADNVRIKVDINTGIVELDAPLAAVDQLLARIEAFVPVLTESRTAEPPAAGASRRKPKREEAADVERLLENSSDPATQAPTKKRAGGRAGQKSQSNLRVLPDLNLRPSGKASLRKFFEEKAPNSNERAFPVIVYYLMKELEIKHVTLNHIYTAFKDLGRKVPTRLGTVMSNSAKRHGWLNTSNMDDVNITIHGENFVEHDLPPKKSKKSKS